MRRSIPAVTLSALASVLPAQVPGADGAVDEEAVAFFLEEGLQRSQVMEHLSWLCDVYGPRVTGSPNLRKAQRWAAEQFGGFGMAPRLEAWGPFGRGWRCDHVSMSAKMSRWIMFSIKSAICMATPLISKRVFTRFVQEGCKHESFA